MSSSNRTIVAILVVVALAAAFWLLFLGPKRQKADDLSSQVEQLRSSLIQAESQAADAARARRKFPADYHQLVTLGKAVPGSDDTSSLLVQLNQIADDSHVKFQSITLQTSASGGSDTTATANTTPGTASAAALTPPTEVAASLLPLGATVGSAGLAVMPYSLTFSGSFFNIADFIQGVDSLVHTGHSNVRATGRLVTLDGFALTGAADGGFPKLDANFAVTTYLVPPSQGVTAGATPTAPAPADDLDDPDYERRKRTMSRLGGPEIKLPKVKAPAFLEDLYYDLRERHLLPLVALLAVAIVAVPIALGNSGSNQPALPPPAVVTLGTSHDGSKIVVTHATPGLRDYQLRLSDLQVKNPFKQQFTKSPPQIGTPPSSGGSGAANSTATTPTGGGSSGSSTTQGSLHLFYVSYDIDVRIVSTPAKGSSAKPTTTVRRHLPVLTQLPSANTPAALYMGVTTNAKKAVMLVSSNVTGVFGDAHCLIGGETCQVLELAPGLPETFVYGVNGRSFRIELLKIHRVITNHPRTASSGGNKGSSGKSGGGTVRRPTVQRATQAR